MLYSEFIPLKFPKLVYSNNFYERSFNIVTKYIYISKNVILVNFMIFAFNKQSTC